MLSLGYLLNTPAIVDPKKAASPVKMEDEPLFVMCHEILTMYVKSNSLQDARAASF